MTLAAKRVFDNDEVQATWDRIRDIVPREQAEEAVAVAVAETRRVLGKRIDRCVYGWSGGKDSQALRVVMERAGVNRCVLGIIPHVEFTAYLTWLLDYSPGGLVAYRNTDITPAWLAPRMHLVFPQTGRDSYFWALQSARFSQRRYQADYDPPFQVYGRRTADGNVCGKDGITHSDATGITSYNPLRTWSHEIVLAVIAWYGLPLPPTYSWPHGWVTGTGAWPSRRVGTPDDGWAETYAIEPERVIEAAKVMPAARDWVRSHT